MDDAVADRLALDVERGDGCRLVPFDEVELQARRAGVDG
jgi:hypothetical protein